MQEFEFCGRFGMECRASLNQKEQMEVAAPFQIKYPKIFRTQTNSIHRTPHSNTLLTKTTHGKSTVDCCNSSLQNDSLQNPGSHLEDNKTTTGVHESDTVGFINSDIFPPRRNYPFTFFKSNTIVIKENYDRGLHPLEITQKDLESTSEWTRLPYNIEKDSKALEHELPLELFDETTPDLDAVFNRFLHEANDNNNGSGIALEGNNWTGWSRLHALDGKFRWEKCTILAYDKSRKLFEIQWETQGGRKWVKRLNLLFRSEDQEAFQQRIRAARLLRDQIKKELVFEAFIDKREVDGLISILDEDACGRINFKVDSSGDVQFSEESLLAVKDMCIQCLKEIEVQMFFIRSQKQRSLTDKGLQNLRVSRPVPDKGCVNVCSQSIKKGHSGGIELSESQWRDEFVELVGLSERSLLIANSSFLQTLQDLVADWDISTTSMFQYSMNPEDLPMSLAEFSNIQETHLVDVTDVIRSDWIYKVMSMIESLTTQGRASSDSKESPPLIHSAVLESIDRLTKVISLMMSSQLKSSVLLSISQWEHFWHNYNNGLKDDDDSARQESRKQCSLFEIGVVWDGTKFEFEPKLEHFRHLANCQLEKMLVLTSDVSDISSKIKHAASDKKLPSIHETHSSVVQAKTKIEDIFSQNERSAFKVLEQLSVFKSVAEMDENCLEISPKESLRMTVVAAVQSLRQSLDEIDSLDNNDPEIHTPLYYIQIGEIKTWLAGKIKKQQSSLLNLLVDEWNSKNDRFLSTFHSHEVLMSKPPNSIEDLCKIRENCSEIKLKLKDTEKEISENNEAFHILHDNQVILEDDAVSIYWQVQFWPEKIREILHETQHTLNERQQQLENDLKTDISNLEQKITSLKTEVKDFAVWSEIKQHNEKIETGQELKKELDDLINLSELYKSRQLAIQLPVMDCEMLTDLKQKLDLHLETWILASNVIVQIPEVFELEIESIKASELYQMLQDWECKTKQLEESGQEEILTLLEEIKTRTTGFAQQLPMVEWIANKDLKQRHWAAISAALGVPMIHLSDHSVNSLIALGVNQISEEVRKQSKAATEEANVHRSLTESEVEWNAVKLETAFFDQIGMVVKQIFLNISSLRGQCFDECKSYPRKLHDSIKQP
eukprot:g8309.t1